jgi:DNA repair exonuclease SbcCD ATPase subunit
MRENAKTAEDERKEAAKVKEQETKAEQEKETLEMKAKIQENRDRLNNGAKETLERMRETAQEQRQNAHDLKMMEMLGMKLDDKQKKLFAPDTKGLEKEVNDSVTTLRQQLAQAQQALKSLRTSASNHYIMGPGKDEIADAESNVKSVQKAIEHLEKNRDAIVKGTAQLGDVIEKAYSIMGGATGVDESDFKPVK